jgi:hypothetical protein
MCVQLPDLPLYALERSAPGNWLMRAPDDDPFLPATVAVAAIAEPSYVGASKWQAANTVVAMRSYPPPHAAKTRAESGDANWRSELLECARLLDRLAPDYHDPERFHLQKDALAHELRRLARWARYPL